MKYYQRCSYPVKFVNLPFNDSERTIHFYLGLQDSYSTWCLSFYPSYNILNPVRKHDIDSVSLIHPNTLASWVICLRCQSSSYIRQCTHDAGIMGCLRVSYGEVTMVVHWGSTMAILNSVSGHTC